MKEKLYMIISMVVFGTIGIFVGYIDMPSGVIAAVRGIVGALVILAVMLVKGHKIDFKRLSKKLPVLLMSGVAIGFNWILLFEAYRHTGIPVATVCYYTAPLLVVAVSPLIFKDKLTVRQIVCIFIALLGVVSVSGVFDANTTRIVGILLGLGAAALYASVMVMNKFMGETDDYERTFIQLITAGLVVLPYGLFTMGSIELELKSVALLIIVGVVHTGISYLMYFSAIRQLKSQTVAILSYIDPASAIILSSIVFVQMPKVYEIIGVVLIMGAAIISEVHKKSSKKEIYAGDKK